MKLRIIMQSVRATRKATLNAVVSEGEAQCGFEYSDTWQTRRKPDRKLKRIRVVCPG